MAMETLVEIIFVIAAVMMILGLLPFGTEVRFILRLSGLILAAPGVALFALIVYPRETLLLLGACSLIAGAGMGVCPDPAVAGSSRDPPVDGEDPEDPAG